MKVSVLFPKEQCYNSEKVNDYLAMRDKFKYWINFLQECGASIECVRENGLAKIIVDEFGIDNSVEWVSLIPESEFKMAQAIKSRDIIPSYMFTDWYVCKHLEYSGIADAHKILPKTPGMTYDEWVNKRIATYNKRYNMCMRKYMDTHAVLFFTNGRNDFCKPRTNFQIGDGTLFITVYLETGYADIRYSGVHIADAEHLKTIMTMGGCN